MPAGLDPWALAGQNADTSGMTPGQLAQFNWLSIYNGVPPDVARSMVNNPSYAEGQRQGGPSWPTPYSGEERDRQASKKDFNAPGDPEGFAQHMFNKMWFGNRRQQNISYQPGGSQMPGMPWDQQNQMSPQDIARMRLMMQIIGARGAGGMAQNPFGGGMQFGQNAPGGGLANQLANPGQGGLMAMIMQNPQLLQWFMQQQQGGPGGPGGSSGSFPQGGGGVTLAQLLGAPQGTGQPA